MRMHNPPHPGEIIEALCLEPLGVTVTQAAEALGVSRKTLSAILNDPAGISPEMAVRLSIAFGISAESWLNQQRLCLPLFAPSNRRFFRKTSWLARCHPPECRSGLQGWSWCAGE